MTTGNFHLELIQTAFDALHRTAGLTGKVLKDHGRRADADRDIDAIVELRTQGKTHRFAVQAKRAVRGELLTQIGVLRPQNQKPPLLLIAPYLTEHLAEKCRQINLPFIDTAGNAYIKDDDLFVYITGLKKPEVLLTQDGAKLKNPTALKVVFAILCNQKLLTATYREIAKKAGVALGAVGPVLKNLEARKFITTLGTAVPKHRLTDAGRLLQEWVTFYGEALRPKLRPRRFRAVEREHLLRANLATYHAYWGGEAAADHLTQHLKPEMLTIYTRENPNRLATDFRLRKDTDGDVEILDAFWNPDLCADRKDNVVPPIIAYADLMATTDGRNLEAGKLIYEQFIAPNLGTR